MADLPRLAVTREQAEHVRLWSHPDRPPRELRLRLPERPTMPCPVGLRLRGGGIGGQMMTECPTCGAVMPSTAGPHPRGVAVPIPEGTRVEVGWWKPTHDAPDGNSIFWIPVATATLAEVTRTYKSTIKDGMQTWIAILVDVEATDG